MPDLMTPRPELAKILEQWNTEEQLAARIAELEAALRGIVRHWNEFGGMMGVNDDYGFSERLDAAEKLTK